jgi:transposase InsO family protein
LMCDRRLGLLLRARAGRGRSRAVLVVMGVVEQRYDAVMAVLRDGHTVVDVAEKFGVARQSVHRWIRRYEAGGLAGLADRSHRPVSCPHQMPLEVEERVVAMRCAHPSWGPLRIVDRLAKEGVVPVPSRVAVYRALVRRGLVDRQRRKRRREDYVRWERSRPNELWQMDVMGGVFLLDERELKVVTGVDDHSRFCVAAGLVERATARPVCTVFAEAMRRWGVPDEVLTDNGKVFSARLGPRPAEVLFDRICRENGIVHRLTGVRAPTTTGKIERFHKTLRTEFLTGPGFATKEEAQAALDAWVVDYNTNRPHQALGMLAPIARFRPEQAEPPAPALKLDGPPRDGQWVTRRVKVNGQVCVDWQRFCIGRQHGGGIVEIHVTDRLFEVWVDGNLVKQVQRLRHGPIRQRRAEKKRAGSRR